MKPTINTIKLKSTLSVSRITRYLGGECSEELIASDMLTYEDEIINAVDSYAEDLAEYMDIYTSYAEKVNSIMPSIEEKNGTLYGVATIEINEDLTPKELKRLIKYIEGQYSDGWGEGFEQQAIEVDNGALYVSFWQPFMWNCSFI